MCFRDSSTVEQSAQLAAKDAEIARLRAAMPSPELLREAAPCRHLDVDAICDECKVFLAAAERIEGLTTTNKEPK